MKEEKSNELFLVPIMKTHFMYVRDGKEEIHKLGFYPGMLGVCPVFETREQAEEWSNGTTEIVEVFTTKPRSVHENEKM